MRIYRLELKRLMKSRRTVLLWLAALLLSALMAWLPVWYEDINQYDSQGNKVAQLNGTKAIQYKKSLRSPLNGEVTPDKLAKALTAYQTAVKPYGEERIYNGEFPIKLYMEQVFPVEALLNRVPEAFADAKTGKAASLMELAPEQMQGFYPQTVRHLQDIMQMEQKERPTAQEQSLQRYSKVQTPFQYYPGYTKDAFDYIALYLFLLVILCTAAVAPTFSGEYQTGSDPILRATRHGRSRLAWIKILAAFSLHATAFILCMALHLLISNLAFGTETLRTSIQMLFSVISLPAYNLGQLQLVLVAGGGLTLFATLSFALYVSARCRDSLTGILLMLGMCLLPIFAYSAGAGWLAYVLPSGGVGLQNGLLYQLTGFNYLHMGQLSLWSPYLLLLAGIVEIPLFLWLAVRAYGKHQVA
jgi:hypothetical protein